MSIDCWPNLLTKTSCSSPHSALPRQLLQSPRPKTLARCHCHDQHPCFWKFVNFFFSSFKVSVVACRLNVSNVCAMLPNHVFQVESFDDYCIKQQPPPLDPYSDCLSFKMMTTARKSFKFFVRQDKSFPPHQETKSFYQFFFSFVKFLVLKISLSWSENKSFWLYIVFLKQISLSSNNQNVFLSSMDVNFIKSLSSAKKSFCSMTRRISTGLSTGSTTHHVFLRSVGKVFQQQAPSLSKFLKSFIPNPEVVHLSLSKFKRSSRDERRPSRLYAVSTWAILQSLSELTLK